MVIIAVRFALFLSHETHTNTTALGDAPKYKTEDDRILDEDTTTNEDIEQDQSYSATSSSDIEEGQPQYYPKPRWLRRFLVSIIVLLMLVLAWVRPWGPQIDAWLAQRVSFTLAQIHVAPWEGSRGVSLDARQERLLGNQENQVGREDDALKQLTERIRAIDSELDQVRTRMSALDQEITNVRPPYSSSQPLGDTTSFGSETQRASRDSRDSLAQKLSQESNKLADVDTRLRALEREWQDAQEQISLNQQSNTVARKDFTNSVEKTTNMLERLSVWVSLQQLKSALVGGNSFAQPLDRLALSPYIAWWLDHTTSAGTAGTAGTTGATGTAGSSVGITATATGATAYNDHAEQWRALNVGSGDPLPLSVVDLFGDMLVIMENYGIEASDIETFGDVAPSAGHNDTGDVSFDNARIDNTSIDDAGTDDAGIDDAYGLKQTMFALWHKLQGLLGVEVISSPAFSGGMSDNSDNVTVSLEDRLRLMVVTQDIVGAVRIVKGVVDTNTSFDYRDRWQQWLAKTNRLVDMFETIHILERDLWEY